jgi:hypothetical protein
MVWCLINQALGQLYFPTFTREGADKSLACTENNKLQDWKMYLYIPPKLHKLQDWKMYLHKPLHVIYKVKKLAYRIWVIVIANKRVKKIYSPWTPEATGLKNVFIYSPWAPHTYDFVVLTSVTHLRKIFFYCAADHPSAANVESSLLENFFPLRCFLRLGKR